MLNYRPCFIMVGVLFLITGVFSVCQLLLCNTVNAGYSTKYSYPSGSIPCKLYNRATGLDCSYRNLDSIPPLSHHSSLEKLDLSYNYKLSSVPDDAFHGLYKLKTLDLSHNYLRNIAGSPFKDLGCLQELNLGFNGIESVNTNTFTGLKRLKNLSLNYNGFYTYNASPVSVYGTPFNGLHSLQNLNISLDCTNKTLFTGLENLTVLTVACTENSDFHSSWSDTFCSLSSLHTLSITSYYTACITNTCLQNIPLKSLYYDTRLGFPCSSSYEFLNNLTSLNVMTGIHNCTNEIQSLSSINVTIERLTIHNNFCELVLDNTTFKPWSKWSSSLLYLDITSASFKIEGSPFVLLTNLRKLHLSKRAEYPGTTLTKIPRETFNGLENLQNLSVNVNLDVVTTNALHVFNNLTYLELKNDQIHGIESFTDVMSSITELDLSDNLLTIYPSVSLSNLRKMNLKNNNIHRIGGSSCENSPHLSEIDMTGSSIIAWLYAPPLCPQFEVIRLSKSTIGIVGIASFPHLKSLYLDHVKDYDTETLLLSVKKIMVMFNKPPKLTTLDLSSNQISDIDKEDTVFLRNLTHLNLANNELRSVDNLQYLTKIKTLILNGNRITTVSDAFFSKTLFMNILDLRNNPFQCDCAVVAFSKWILQDDEIYLIADDEGSNFINGVYQCYTPDSTIGLSLTEIDLDCRSPLELYLSVSIACAFVAILMAISVIRYRWHIQYQLFLLCTRRKRYQHYLDNDYGLDDDEENESGIPRFDAYVAYHEKDEDWVDEELLQNIEEGDEHFRLCLRSRDVPAGRVLINSVSMCIQRSRKTLIILTPRFVEDNWCYFQLSMAHQRFLEEGRNVLILITLEEIPNEKMTLILRQLFCKVRCLKWPNDGYGQYLFWRRLKEEIKRPMCIDRRYHI